MKKYAPQPLIFCLIIITLLVSCKKFVQIDPPRTQLVSNTVFDNDATATSALMGVYSKIMDNSSAFNGAPFSLYLGLSADEFQDYSTNSFQTEFYTNSLTSVNPSVNNFWINYNIIYSVNSIIEGLTKSSGTSEAVRNNLLGESKFIRAFYHFYLTNIFGDIPYVTTTDYRKNTSVTRASQHDVYENIISDLNDALNLLSKDYSGFGGERIRPTVWAAHALLARTYLYNNDWVNAEVHSSLVLNNTSLFSLKGNLDSVFLKNSSEAIWQMMPVRSRNYTWEGNQFVLTGMPTSVALQNQMANIFEASDKRKSSWLKSINVGANLFYYPYKYKVKSGTTLTEYSMVLRLAEQYLIRAEARAQQLNISGAQSDLNLIRNRAGLPNTTATDKAGILTAILHERQVELFTEWGHRWLDLKRTGNVDVVMNIVTPQKGGTWSTNWKLYPIPQGQLNKDPNMVGQQNPGY